MDVSVYTEQTPHMLGVLESRLRVFGYKPRREIDWMYAPGEIPILLVAHVDTVLRRQPPREHIVIQDGVVSALYGGLGADDRAGVDAILEILLRGKRPHVLFLDGEERGGIGASSCAMEMEKPDVRYAIQLDRRGSEDCVFYDLEFPEFENYVESFGFKKSYGTFTDISILCPAFGFAGVNLSIGYMGEHTQTERLVLEFWLKTVERVCKMLDSCPDTAFPYVSSKSPEDDDEFASLGLKRSIFLYLSPREIASAFGLTNEEAEDFIEKYAGSIEEEISATAYRIIRRTLNARDECAD